MITHHDLMLLQSTQEPFSRENWLYELKYDGLRCLIRKHGKQMKLISRNGRDMAGSFPELISELARLPDVVMDGELVVLDEDGRPQFERLCHRARHTLPVSVEAAAKKEAALIFAFDLLSIRDNDCRHHTTLKRKQALQKVLRNGERVRYAEHIETDGEALFRFAERMALEGIVAKKADAPYVSGRSWDWIKVKTAIGREAEARRFDRPSPTVAQTAERPLG